MNTSPGNSGRERQGQEMGSMTDALLMPTGRGLCTTDPRPLCVLMTPSAEGSPSPCAFPVFGFWWQLPIIPGGPQDWRLDKDSGSQSPSFQTTGRTRGRKPDGSKREERGKSILGIQSRKSWTGCIALTFRHD